MNSRVLKMNERTLLLISLTGALVGLLILFYISEKIQLPISEISSITRSQLDQNVKVQGYVTYFKETKGLYIFKVKDSTGEIQAILFKDQPVNLAKNDYIELEGSITEYQGKLEIQGENLRLL
jgi:RecJ-like exonuclease